MAREICHREGTVKNGHVPEKIIIKKKEKEGFQVIITQTNRFHNISTLTFNWPSVGHCQTIVAWGHVTQPQNKMHKKRERLNYGFLYLSMHKCVWAHTHATLYSKTWYRHLIGGEPKVMQSSDALNHGFHLRPWLAAIEDTPLLSHSAGRQGKNI